MNNTVISQHFVSAALEALQQFPLDVASLEPVAESENVTFRVKVLSSSRDFVLRLHRPGYNTLEELESERRWCAALADAGLHVQRAVPTLAGAGFCQVEIPGDLCPRYAGVTTWLPGVPLSAYLETLDDTAERQRIFREIGEMAALLHNQSAAWSVPPEFERCRLDRDGLLGESPRWGRFWEHKRLSPAERQLLLDTRASLIPVLDTYGESPERFGVIHADLHPENIVVDDGQLGLIDFDDTAWGWHLYDLASALVEQWSAADFPAIRRALLEGYRRLRALSEEDEALLDRFILLRGMALIGWFHERPEHDDSAFFDEILGRVLETCKRHLACS